MKLIFMGTPDFAVGTLEALCAAGHEVTLAVSQPDRPRGRGHQTAPTPVKEAALRLGLKVYQPLKLRDPETAEVLLKTEADAVVVAAFGQIIPPSILHMKKYGCINVHASLLPAYRGAAPVQWAVINGEKESGITIMQMDEGLDTGDILLQKSIPLDEDETGGSLFEKLSRLGASACTEALEKLEEGSLHPVKQGETTTAYASMLTKEMGHIDWTGDAGEIERLIRGLSPSPGTYALLSGRTLKIWKAVPAALGHPAAPGEVVRVTKNDFTVACGEGLLVIKEVQLQGKKRMDTAAFLRGFRIEEGTVLL